MPITDHSEEHEKKPRATGIDAHIGMRIRLLRTLMKMTQEDLGTALGLSYQQVQKYERGVNRISGARLVDLSNVLNVPIGFFFDDLPDRTGNTHGNQNTNLANDVFSRVVSLELLHAYDRIPDEAVRKRVLDLIKSMSPE
jgi:transcriptional regulator with XRE-family HTH domain